MESILEVTEESGCEMTLSRDHWRWRGDQWRLNVVGSIVVDKGRSNGAPGHGSISKQPWKRKGKKLHIPCQYSLSCSVKTGEAF